MNFPGCVQYIGSRKGKVNKGQIFSFTDRSIRLFLQSGLFNRPDGTNMFASTAQDAFCRTNRLVFTDKFHDWHIHGAMSGTAPALYARNSGRANPDAGKMSRQFHDQ